MRRQSHHARLRVPAAMILAVALLVPLSSPATARPSAGMTPAIGLQPHYQKVGRAHPDQPPTFSCQLTTPATCYGPAQIRAAYGVDKLPQDGAGRTIVIVDAFQSPTIRHDLATFDALFELPDPTLDIIAPQGLTPFDQNDPNQVGWAGEITLDVEWAHAIAPAARIDLVLSASNQDSDILAAQEYAIHHNVGDVLSQSFGEAEQCEDPAIQAATHRLFRQAAHRRMTVLASSGDQGAAQPTCDGTSFFKAASTPASDPYVTGIGGTLLDADGRTGAYHSETTWNEPQFAAAGGGGVSVIYPRPAYQAGHTLAGRGVPDVAYNAGINSGVLAVWSSSGQGADLVFRFGGTSAGSPQWAGLVALADQQRHGRIGFMNDALYTTQLSQRVYTSVFHDVTTGDNTYHGAVTVPGFAAGTGYDLATGLGTPMANHLVPLLAATG
jgi:subtilase family serine protease